MERIIFRSYMPEYFHTHAWIIFTFWSTSSHLPWGTAALTLGLHTNHARFVTNSNGISYDPYFTAAGRFADTCTLLGSISCSSYRGRFSGKLLAYMPGSQTTLWKFELTSCTEIHPWKLAISADKFMPDVQAVWCVQDIILVFLSPFEWNISEISCLNLVYTLHIATTMLFKHITL
jgi:hypothetical protein